MDTLLIMLIANAIVCLILVIILLAVLKRTRGQIYADVGRDIESLKEQII